MITKIELNEGRMIAKLPMTPWQKKRIVKLHCMLNELPFKDYRNWPEWMKLKMLFLAKEHFTNN